MAGIYSRYKTDPILEKETGVLLNLGTNSKGKDFLIRVLRAGGSNDAYNKRLEAKFKPHRRQIQTDTMDKELFKRLLQEVYADTIVIDWENAEDENDQDLPFTKENVLKIFKDIPEIWEQVAEDAQKAAMFRAEIREGDVKN